MHPTNWKKLGNYFKHNDFNIFYREQGTGEVLLLVHGFPTASWDWYKIWDQLASKYQLLAPDMIGFGYSDKPKNYDYRIMDQADLHETLLQEKGITSIHILAHDYGNTVVQELLARYLDRKEQGQALYEIKSICFLNGGLFPEMHRPKLIQKLLISPIGGLLGSFMGKSKLRSNFQDIFGKNSQPTEEEIDHFWDLIMYNNGKAILHKLIRYMSDRKQHRERWVNAILKAPIPIRLIDGPEDPVSGRHLVNYYREMVPNADVVVLEGIGHYPQVEAPELVLEGVLEFLIE